MKHQPPLNDYRSRLRWCIETILRPVGIGHGRRMDIGPAERMQRGRDWYDAMDAPTDSKHLLQPPRLHGGKHVKSQSDAPPRPTDSEPSP